MINKSNKILISTLLAVGLTSVSSLQAAEKSSRGLYVGLFGGGTTSDNNSFTQSGVAYKRNGDGQAHDDYDLLVDTKGNAGSKTGALGGLHIGYEFQEIPMASSWGLRPAIEFEGYYLGTKISGNLANPQHEPGIDFATHHDHGIAAGTHKFTNSFNLDMGVLLVNAVFTFKTPLSDRILPYIGAGIGAAITSISGANSLQTDPAYEPTVNHFNSNSRATSSAFAVQAKAGIRAEIIDHISLFAEYRYLNVSAANYTFGATVYPGSHSATSNWNSHFGSMGFHSGVLGIEYSF